MNELCESLKCLCNSPQRLQILGILNGTEMDVRDLMTTLDSSRSTVQRNLSKLKKQGWIEDTRSGYTTTTVGGLLHRVFVTTNETTAVIQRMAPFFEAVDVPLEIEIDRFNDALVTTPRPGQPNAPMKRLFETFDGADSVRGFIPVVSYLVVELFRRANRDIAEHEYIVSDAVFSALREQNPTEWMDESGKNQSVRVTIQLYKGNIPYGLFISEERLALAAYDEIDRIRALVESTNEEAVEWGECMYETYRHESTDPEMDIQPVARDAELVD